LPKRIEKTIEAQKEFRTPKGKITAKEYIRKIDKRTKKEIEREMPPSIKVTYNKRYKSGKMDDALLYPFRDGKGITITALNVNHVLAQIRKIDIPDLMEHIDTLFRHRQIFYRDRLVGAIIHYKTKDMPDEPKPRGVAFHSQREFEQYLFDMIDTMLTDDIFRKESTKDGIVYLTYLEIFVRTRQTPTIVEQML
jgi:hypothetical protein